MAIDTSGKWWRGGHPEDIGDYLKAYSSDGYKVRQFRLAKCDCGSLEFELEADRDEEVARRTCISCRKTHPICGSADYWDDAEPKAWKCVECGSRHANVGVGFALYDDDPSGVHWLYVGERCAKCGVLGCIVDWKVALSDAMHLLDEV
jgi:hypothetical protein